MGFFRNLAYFVAGLACAAALLYSVVPRDRPVLNAALANRETCEVLLVGPSYIASGILGGSFEAESKRLGQNLTLCKYGQVELEGFELKHALELLLAHPWPKLKYLLVDITLGDGVDRETQNWFKPRVVDWHHLEALPWIYARYERRKGGISAYLPAMWAHAQQVLLNYLGIGRGIFPLRHLGAALGAAGEQGDEQQPVAKLRKKRGVRPRDTDVLGELERAKKEKALIRARGQYASDAWPKELRELVESHGKFDLIFMLSPVLTCMKPVRGASETPGRLVVFDFEDPERYPELYTPNVRGHSSHLRPPGPRIYSELLAHRLFEYEQARSGSVARP